MRRSRNFVLPLSMRFVHRYISATFMVMLPLMATAIAQDPQAGIMPFSTQVGGAYESVDLASDSVFVKIPIRSKAGKIPFEFSLIMSTHAYSLYNMQNKNWQWYITFPSLLGQIGGFSMVGGGPLLPCEQNEPQVLPYLIVTDPTGATHRTPNFNPGLSEGGDQVCNHNTFPQVISTSDGSGYTAVLTGVNGATTWTTTLYDKSGNSFPGGLPPNPYVYIQDPDGAQIYGTGITLGSSYTDTLGATALTYDDSGWPTSSKWEWTDAAGNTQTFQINSTYYEQQTSFGCGVSNPEILPQYSYAPTSIVTPDGTYYLAYEKTPSNPNNITGRLASITYPTGGKVTYTYGGSNNGVVCKMGTVPTLTRQVYDPTSKTTSTWTYTGVNSGATTNSQVTVNDPANNQTVYTFYGETEIEKQVYEGTVASGSLLEKVFTCYNGSNTSQSACSGIPIANGPQIPVKQVDVYTYRNNSSSPSLVETIYDCNTTTPCYGNIVSVANYDFGATFPASGSPVSKTLTTYNIASGGVYPCGTLSNPYMFDRPCSVTTVNSAGATVSQVKYTYDPKGHLLTTSRWVSPSAANLVSSTSYNSNGTVNIATDVNGTTSTYSYSGVCDSLMPTGVAILGNNVNLSRSMAWDCNGGVQTSLTDNQNQTTTTMNFSSGNTADPHYRPVSTVDPANNTTAYSYPATTFESAMNFNGTVSTNDVVTTTDGLGRTIYSQTRQAQTSSNFDSTQTSYGWTTTTSLVAGGPYTKQSVPYQQTQGQGAPANTPVTTTQFDALNRPLTVTDAGGGTVSYTYTANTMYDVLRTVGPIQNFQKQFEYDGLGRLASVCEITSATGSGSCGQSNAQTGFLTKYTYDTLGNILQVKQNAQTGATPQTRTFVYDGLSRLTSESNPESGTVTYAYDTIAPPGICAGWTGVNGDLLQITKADGSWTCYEHDGLRRLTDVGNGSQSTVNSCKRFRYDSPSNGRVTQPSGATFSNVAGRLVEVETDYVNMITDEWFSYDADGHVTDVYQATPNSGGYYHTTAQYFANGAVNTLSGIPGLNAWTYNVEGEGRPSSVTYGASTNWVTGTTYYPTNSQTTVSYGNGDSDVYSFDATTGRMKGFQFNVGTAPQTLAGTLGWNANWTLGSLAITDSLNPSNSQNCSYGFDALQRISSVGCASPAGANVWGQTFTFDAFGNITKSVPNNDTGTSFLPTYSSTTNQFNLSACTVTYDANGNLTNDCNNTYTWNVYGRPATIGSKSITYDALDQEVEIGSGSTYTQVLYSPIGKIGLMSGQTFKNIRIPLPGGGSMEDVGSQTRILHSDWLGSSRLSTLYGNRTLAYDAGYAPYGETYGTAGSQSDIDFTGMRPDTQTGLYDFPAREYSPSQGRWISPDPAGLAAADPGNPQSWNRYAYVLNNPLKFIDPTGMYCFYGGKGDTTENDSDPSDYDFTDQQSDCHGQWIDNPSTTVTVNGNTGESDSISTFPTDVNATIQRSFSRQFPCNKSASSTIGNLESNFPQNADWEGGPLHVTFLQQGQLQQGGVILIDGLVGAWAANDSAAGFMHAATSAVSVTSVGSDGFTFATVPGMHPFDNGTVTFSASDSGNGNINFSVDVNAQFSDKPSQFIFNKLGGSAVEASIWHNLINNVQAGCHN